LFFPLAHLPEIFLLTPLLIPVIFSSRSVFSQWGVICSEHYQYLCEGGICPGVFEERITRNPGGETNILSGLPTSREIESMFEMDVDFDTPPFDTTSNMSMRNMIEGFANPSSGISGENLQYLPACGSGLIGSVVYRHGSLGYTK